MTAEPVRDDDRDYDYGDADYGDADHGGVGYRGAGREDGGHRDPARGRSGPPASRAGAGRRVRSDRGGAARDRRAQPAGRRGGGPRRSDSSGRSESLRTRPAPRRIGKAGQRDRRAGSTAESRVDEHGTGRSARDRRTSAVSVPRQSTAASSARPKAATGAAAADRRRTAPPPALPLPRTPFVLLVLGVVAAGIVGLLVLNTAINTNSLRVQQLRSQHAALEAQEQQLDQELADLSSPGNLQAAATRMGLVPAGRTAFIRLPDGKVIGVPQPVPEGGADR